MGKFIASQISRCQIPVWPIAQFMIALMIMLVVSGTQSIANPSLETLLGSWRGTGLMHLRDGRSERLTCNTYYTGGATQLGMVIRCQGETNRIEIRSKLTNSAGRLTGHWEERTYNAKGRVAGRLTGSRIALAITGAGLTGHMSVSYSRSKQDVSISTQGIGLERVKIRLYRQR